ncbi:MAG: hypothetical protein IIX15_01860 [Clostridia bacterium]|nr:hypothetical protein [Clostridia bacterium]
MTYLHILKGEIKKLWSNRAFLLLLLLLALMCGYVASRQPVTVPSWQDELEQYLDAYEADPEGVVADIRARVEAIDALIKQQQQATVTGQGIPTMNEEQVEEYRRRSLYRELLSLFDREGEYRTTLNDVIRTARKNYANYLSSGIPEESFVVRYQIGVVTHYTEQLGWEMDFPVGQVRGYDHILKDNSYQVFLLLALLVGAVLLLLPEKSGMLSLLRSTKGGRGTTIAAKLTTGAIMSLALTVGFSLIPAIIFVAKTGLGGGLLPLQYVFPTAPYHTSVLGGLLIRLGVQAAVGTVFVWCVLLLTVPLRHTVSALGAGGGIIAVSYLLGLWGRTHPHNLFHLFNLMTVLDSSAHLSQWNAFHFGKWSVDYIVTLPIFLLAALLLFGGLTTWAFVGRRCPIVLTASGRYSRLQSLTDAAVQKVRATVAKVVPKKQRRMRFYGTGVLGWEWSKTLRRLLSVVCLALLLISEVQTVKNDYAPVQTYEDNVYHQYMTRFEGEWSEEKSAAIAAEAARLSDLASSRDQLEKDYREGKIDEATFRTRYTEANDAEMRLEAFEAVTERDRVLRELHKAGHAVSFVYDTGWKRYLYDTDFDVAAAAIILLLAGLFADEYTGGFARILRTTKHGRRKTLLSKAALTASTALGISLLQNGTRLFTLTQHYDLPAPSALAMSVGGMEALPWTSCSILTLMIAVTVMRALGLLLLAFLTVSLSALCRLTLPTVLLSAAAVFLSRLLSLFGLTLLDALTLNNTLAATPLLLNVASRAAALIALAVTLGLTMLAAWRERGFGK